MANVTPADVENITLNFAVPVELSMDIIAALNILFSITASLGNTLILVALRKVTSLYPPTKLLFLSAWRSLIWALVLLPSDSSPTCC